MPNCDKREVIIYVNTGEYREPRRGEFYLSSTGDCKCAGSFDLSTQCHILTRHTMLLDMNAPKVVITLDIPVVKIKRWLWVVQILGFKFPVISQEHLTEEEVAENWPNAQWAYKLPETEIE